MIAAKDILLDILSDTLADIIWRIKIVLFQFKWKGLPSTFKGSMTEKALSLYDYLSK